MTYTRGIITPYRRTYVRGAGIVDIVKSFAPKLGGLFKAGAQKLMGKLKDRDFQKQILQKVGQPALEKAVEFGKDKVLEKLKDRFAKPMLDKALDNVATASTEPVALPVQATMPVVNQHFESADNLDKNKLLNLLSGRGMRRGRGIRKVGGANIINQQGGMLLI